MGECRYQGSTKWFAILLCSVLVCNYAVILKGTVTLINLLCVCMQLVLRVECVALTCFRIVLNRLQSVTDVAADESSRPIDSMLPFLSLHTHRAHLGTEWRPRSSGQQRSCWWFLPFLNLAHLGESQIHPPSAHLSIRPYFTFFPLF